MNQTKQPRRTLADAMRSVGRAATMFLLAASAALSTITGAGAQKPAGDPAAAIQKQVDQMGADIAIVTAAQASVRSKPNAAAVPIATVPRSGMLALVSRAKNGPFYNVIHVQTGKEGWVNGSDVRVFFTKVKKQSSGFQASRTRGDKNPQVIIANNTDREMSLKIGESRFSVPAGAKKTVILPPGNHSYYASVPGVMPAFGSRAFDKGNAYTWSFSIRTTVRRR
jgi:hypothetical protein